MRGLGNVSAVVHASAYGMSGAKWTLSSYVTRTNAGREAGRSFMHGRVTKDSSLWQAILLDPPQALGYLHGTAAICLGTRVMQGPCNAYKHT